MMLADAVYLDGAPVQEKALIRLESDAAESHHVGLIIQKFFSVIQSDLQAVTVWRLHVPDRGILNCRKEGCLQTCLAVR